MELPARWALVCLRCADSCARRASSCWLLHVGPAAPRLEEVFRPPQPPAQLPAGFISLTAPGVTAAHGTCSRFLSLAVPSTELFGDWGWHPGHPCGPGPVCKWRWISSGTRRDRTPAVPHPAPARPVVPKRDSDVVYAKQWFTATANSKIK